MIKLIVVGIDGANWELVNPWIEEGILPNIKKLKENGCFADHSSCLPPVTYPNWKCYSTGKNPGKLGVFRFDHIDCNKKNFTIHNSRSFKSKEFWDYMNLSGIKAGIINMPTTYPPRKINKFLISGGPDASESKYRSDISKYTYPEDLEKYLEEKFDYKVHPHPYLSSKKDGEQEINSILNLIDLRFKVGINLLEKEKVDFLQITLFYINALQHFFWNKEPVKRAWIKIDENIGKLLDKTDNIILMSDHGCCEIKKVFFINRWLEKEGYLKTKKTTDDYLYSLGLSKERLLKIANTLKITNFLNKIIPESILQIFPREEGIKGKRKLDKIIWEKTIALGSNQGPIYLNMDKNSPDYEKYRNEIIKKLEEVKNPETGLKIFKKVYKAEEIYNGPYLKDAPDLMIDQKEGFHVSEGMGNGKLISNSGNWEADNKTTGFFLAHGKDIKKDGEQPKIKILDIAPTILHLFNVPVPEDIDGNVLKNIFKPESEPGKRDIKHKKYEKHEEKISEESEKEKELIKERLRNLGYI